MRFMNLCLMVSFAYFISGASDVAFAKSDKFKRSAPATPEVKTDGAKSDGKLDIKPAEVPSGDKKVDVTDLENRYWTAKDSEFTVVQNRLYTKAKKFSATLFAGPVLSDSYSNSMNYGLALNYYFSEREGVEIQGWKTSATPNDVTNYFSQRFSASPDYNIPKGYIGASYNWIPIYAKLSLLEKKILYFDMSISPGLGVTFMEATTFRVPPTYADVPNNPQAPITLALDVAQQVFLNEHWALRLDLRNHFYQEKIYRANAGTESTSKTTYYGTIMLGVTFFQ